MQLANTMVNPSQTTSPRSTERESADGLLMREFVVTGRGLAAMQMLFFIARGSDQCMQLSTQTFQRRLESGRVTLQIHEYVHLVFQNGVHRITEEDTTHHVVEVVASDDNKEIDFGLCGNTFIVSLPQRPQEESLVGHALLCIEHIERQLASLFPGYQPRQSTMVERT